MVGLKVRDISRDVVMIFVICYEYSMSFTNVLKLFQISKKYFWTFMEVCSPMIKMGVRKAACIRKTVDKILNCFKNPDRNVEVLNPREEKIFEALTWFIEDSFSDGEACLHVSQFAQMPFAEGYTSKGVRMATNYKNLVSNIDALGYIKIGDAKYYKTSRILYYMERFSGDTDIKELDSLSVNEMIKRIVEGERQNCEKEEEYYAENERQWV